MELIYFKGKNFGDALNAYLWNALISDVIKPVNPEIGFLGIGSLLGLHQNYAPPSIKKIVVFGSGYAYGNPPVLDNQYDLFFLRGPISAKFLKVEEKENVITDSALLIRTLKLANQEKKYKYSFMPHWCTEFFFDWKKICEDADIKYLSPSLPVEQLLTEILKSERLLTEAMHGAIIADAFRVPWVALRCYDHINKLKWHDWCYSVFMDYTPIEMPSLYDLQHSNGKLSQYDSKENGDFNMSQFVQKRFVGNSSVSGIDRAKRELSKLKNASFSLTNSSMLKKLENRMISKLDLLRSKYGSGGYI
ncbi:polysaccharide pyruvyl transferase family protein [Fulvivirgaceae bacterium PWU4]|uniref:Polysaccharide pyruvyl transferase family protein n=1 Tax=Chryseosolibacter histidini TaxID=2782349 RepID=A0AAP2GKB3_9BACT|nr:polysaccharide pyruvyl transferase family protein [Chryseosolibacter histidini]MBT1699141.1 polysaccharide pyruvyl transferase family protein [Chryseosolibacter histidini]